MDFLLFRRKAPDCYYFTKIQISHLEDLQHFLKGVCVADIDACRPAILWFSNKDALFITT